MTISIIETVTTAAAAVTFAEVLDKDVALVAMKWTDDGSLLSSVDTGGWNSLEYTGSGTGIWRQLTAGETSLSWPAVHIGSMQTIAVLLRSDVYSGLDAIEDEATDWGETAVTDYADDPLMAISGSDTNRGGFTTALTFVLHAELGNVAMWRHDPLQVPLGTTIFVEGTGDTNMLHTIAWRPWSAAAEVLAVAVTGWQTWIID